MIYVLSKEKSKSFKYLDDLMKYLMHLEVPRAFPDGSTYVSYDLQGKMKHPFPGITTACFTLVRNLVLKGFTTLLICL